MSRLTHVYERNESDVWGSGGGIRVRDLGRVFTRLEARIELRVKSTSKLSSLSPFDRLGWMLEGQRDRYKRSSRRPKGGRGPVLPGLVHHASWVRLAGQDPEMLMGFYWQKLITPSRQELRNDSEERRGNKVACFPNLAESRCADLKRVQLLPEPPCHSIGCRSCC